MFFLQDLLAQVIAYLNYFRKIKILGNKIQIPTVATICANH